MALPLARTGRGRAAFLTARRALAQPGGKGARRMLACATASPAGSAALLDELRGALKSRDVDAFIVPTDDPHMSEYTAAFFGRRERVSGFTGSAGTAVITKDKALLWTDGRYFLQAENELGPEWTLMKMGLSDTPTIKDFLGKELEEGSTVGVDPFVHPAGFVEDLKERLEAKSLRLSALAPPNPVDGVWPSRPAAPASPMRPHPLEYAGVPAETKLAQLREAMAERGADALVVTALDEIMYALNVRGADVPCNPVSVCYLVVGADEAVLYVDDAKLGPPGSPVREQLAAAGVTTAPYADAREGVASLAGRVWMDKRTANYALWSSVDADRRIEAASPLVLMKAVKNDAELAGMRAAHERDGAALVEFMAWLDEWVERDGKGVRETEVAARLLELRSERELFIEPSFPTIAGVNENGAVIHYSAVEESAKELTRGGMILIDSGGQYADGTTDCTRTLHLGEPTPRQREMFTRVLRGHIAVNTAVFPEGTPGFCIDPLARRALWQAGVDYAHGTGHGVGAALNVHEGPQGISPRHGNTQPLLPGMVVSNEPGFYAAGEFGVRIENLLVVRVDDNLPEFNGKRFLHFESLTMVPVQAKMIDPLLMAHEELAWLDAYHSRVREVVEPLLTTDRAREWLRKATAPLLKGASV